MLICSQDQEWGPISTCRPFDLTVYFEQAALFSADAIFIVFATLRILYLRSQEKREANSGTWISTISVFLVLCSTVVSSWYGSRNEEDSSLSIVWFATRPALQLQVVSSMFLAVVSRLELRRVSPASSSLVAIFALAKCLLTVVVARTYLSIFRTLAISFAFASASYAILMCTEIAQQRAKISIPYMRLLPLLWKGKDSTITMQDFGPVPTHMSADDTYATLHEALLTTNKTKRFYLFVASFKAFGPSFLAPVFPRLCLLAATSVQPFLVSRMLHFISDADEPSSTGWNIVAGYVLVFIIISVSTGIYWKKSFDFIVEYRGALVGVIYHKTLVLSAASGRASGGAVASTYMSVDVDRISKAAEMIHEFWLSGVAVFVAIFLLYLTVSWLAILPVIVIAAMMGVSSLLTPLVTRAQMTWLLETDHRVKFITSVVHNFLPIKWSSYEQVLAERGAVLRENELGHADKYMKYVSYTVTISNVASNGCILVVLAGYSLLYEGSIDAAMLFTIVAILNLLATPLLFLGQVMPIFAAAWASLMRIQGYLLLDEAKAGLIELDEGVDSENAGLISLKSASFSWSPTDESPFLKDVSLQLDKPQLHLVVGPVASGKTMLLLSMLGETVCTSGDYSCPRFRVAYAQQDTFVIPASIRENITFGLPFKPEWYERVIEACALKTDLDKLKLGDGTMLNEKGNQLSGGQKQRVALARAVYANATWTFLDDPLSALDAHTEAHVFKALFGPTGLLRGKSVVLVTHNLKYIGDADAIIVLEGGKVNHQGTLSDIRAQGYIFEALTTNSNEKTAGKDDIAEKSSSEYIREEDVAEPPIAPTSLGLVPYLFMTQMMGRRRAAILVIGVLIASITSLASQYYLRGWSNSRGENAGAWIGGYIGLTVFLLVFIGFAFYNFVYSVVVQGGKHLHAEELRGFLRAPPTLIANLPTGRIVNRFTQDINRYDFQYPFSLWNTAILIVLVVGNTVFIMIPIPSLALSLIPLSALYYLNLILYLGTSKQLEHLEASSKSPMYTLSSTTVTGLITIRSLRVQEYFLAQNKEYLNISQAPFYFRYGGVQFMRTLLTLISAIMAIGLASLAVRFRDVVDPSAMGLALVALTTLPSFLARFLISLANLENSSVALSRIHEIATMPAEPEKHDDAPLVELSGDWIKYGGVTFENVELRYRQDLDPAVKSVSFKIAPGQKIGVCGRSGSGKSTLIMALFRALEADGVSGKILIDDVDIQSISLNTLRSSLGLVAQDPFIWNAPVRHNLDPRDEHPDKDLWTTLQRVGLDGAVAALSDKLDTVLNDEAALSKGQRQLLCLARVLLRKSKIVVLDEASSSLDLDSDEKMRQVIHSDLSECTVITVAHRIATIVDYNLILVMDSGRLVESGAPKELLNKPGSMFGKLAERQGVKASAL